MYPRIVHRCDDPHERWMSTPLPGRWMACNRARQVHFMIPWGWPGWFCVSFRSRIKLDRHLFILAQIWLISNELWLNSYNQMMRHVSTDSTQTQKKLPPEMSRISSDQKVITKKAIQWFDSKATGNDKKETLFPVNGWSQKLSDLHVDTFVLCVTQDRLWLNMTFAFYQTTYLNN